MTVLPPETTKTYGQQSLVVLDTEPAETDGLTEAELAAGTNITLHVIGQWFLGATTEKVSRERKMGQTKTTQSIGQVTWEAPPLQYTFNNQTVNTPSSDGNEAFEALPEGAVRYLALFTGVPGDEEPEDGDAYELIGVRLGPQVRGQSADGAGAESTVTQELEVLPEYSDGPVDGVVVAGT